jgi:hypothetical protein
MHFHLTMTGGLGYGTLECVHPILTEMTARIGAMSLL